MKAYESFPKFLEKNKKFLSGYEIGQACIELSSCSSDFNSAYKYYSQANNFLNDNFESKKMNLNKIVEFGDTLIEQGDKSKSDKFKDLYKKYIKLYKTYYNLDKEEIEIFIEINKKQNSKDLLIRQENALKNLKFEQQYLVNKNDN